MRHSRSQPLAHSLDKPDTTETTAYRRTRRPKTDLLSAVLQEGGLTHLMAPGPATDHIISRPAAVPGISKALLLALARTRNVSAGRGANAGLEDFLPPPRVAQAKPLFTAQISRRKGGFKPVSVTSASSPARDKQKKLRRMRQNLSGTASEHNLLAENTAKNSVSFTDFREFRHKVQRKVNFHIEKLTKRLILSKKDNTIRATTMATVQIAAKARHHRILKGVMRSHEASKANSPCRPSFLRGDLLVGLQATVVDTLAVSEIHTRKRDEQRAAFPKLTNAQIQAKLVRLRVAAQEAFKPLQATQSLEVQRLIMYMGEERRLPVIKVRVETQSRVQAAPYVYLPAALPAVSTSARKGYSPVLLSIRDVQQPEMWVPSLPPSATKKAHRRGMSLKRTTDREEGEKTHFREYQPILPSPKPSFRLFRGTKRLSTRTERSHPASDRLPASPFLNLTLQEPPLYAKTRSPSSPEARLETAPLVKAMKLRTPRVRVALW